MLVKKTSSGLGFTGHPPGREIFYQSAWLLSQHTSSLKSAKFKLSWLSGSCFPQCLKRWFELRRRKEGIWEVLERLESIEGNFWRTFVGMCILCKVRLV